MKTILSELHGGFLNCEFMGVSLNYSRVKELRTLFGSFLQKSDHNLKQSEKLK